MIVDAQGMKSWPYWQPGQGPEFRFARDEEYAEQLKALLEMAVNARTRSVFPVGAHLSSGIDSSALAVLAARSLRSEGKALAGGFSWSPALQPDEEVLENDERLLIQQVCTQENIRAYYAKVRPRHLAEIRFRRRLNSMFDWSQEVDIRRQAEALGIRTLLSGWGGDELIAFNGRGFFLEMLRHGRWLTCFQELKMRADLHNSNVLNGVLSKLILPWISDELIATLCPNGKIARRIQRVQRDIPRAFRDDFRFRIASSQPLQKPELSERMGVRPFQLALIDNGHLVNYIESWTMSGARHGITYTYPLLDRRIVEFALGLPPEMFMKNGWKRWLYRESLDGILPDNIRWNKRKHEPSRSAQRTERLAIQREYVDPWFKNALREWVYSGGEFICLDPERVKNATSGDHKNDDNESSRAETGLIQAFKVELLVNRALADEMEARMGELDTCGK